MPLTHLLRALGGMPTSAWACAGEKGPDPTSGPRRRGQATRGSTEFPTGAKGFLRAIEGRREKSRKKIKNRPPTARKASASAHKETGTALLQRCSIACVTVGPGRISDEVWTTMLAERPRERASASGSPGV